MKAFNQNFETFQNLDVDPADTIQTVTYSLDVILTHYGEIRTGHP